MWHINYLGFARQEITKSHVRTAVSYSIVYVFRAQTDAGTAQDALMEALHVLSEQACRYLLLPTSDLASSSSGATVVTAAEVWAALHAVRRLYRGPMTSEHMQCQGSTDALLGLDSQVN